MSKNKARPKRPPPRPAYAETKPTSADKPTLARPGGTKAPPPPTSNRNLIFIIAAIVSVLVCGALLFLILAPKGGGTALADSEIAVAPDPNAKVEQFPNLGQDHLPPGEKYSGTYNSDPPTSGPHDPIPLAWRVFTTPQRDEALIHNLEHGGIAILVDCPNGCPTAIQNLSAYVNRYPPDIFTGALLAPRKLPNGARIAVLAWQNRLLLNSLDAQKINQFISNFYNKGPERAF